MKIPVRLLEMVFQIDR